MDRPHKRLNIWLKIIDLIILIYELLKNFPGEEKFGLTSQIKHSVISIASNVAEGAARKTKKDKNRFWIIARGSLSELDGR